MKKFRQKKEVPRLGLARDRPVRIDGKSKKSIDFHDFSIDLEGGRDPEDFGSQTMNRRSAGARPSWPGLEISRFLEPGRLAQGPEALLSSADGSVHTAVSCPDLGHIF